MITNPERDDRQRDVDIKEPRQADEITRDLNASFQA
jgi:hypothetical protein